ncbi:16S rRNA (cytosine(1402)-N(4))-methyltransferase RsmH [Treponema sp. R6D11]
MKMEFIHKTVLLEETVSAINPRNDGVYVDGTLGGGGHSSLLLKTAPDAKLIAIDRDKDAHKSASKKLKGNVEFIHDNFSNIKSILGNRKIDGAILDLGVSSYQFDEPARGFSYRFDSPLDMRMDQTQELTAEIIINSYEQGELSKIFWNYAEEKYAKRISQNIIDSRPIKTTGELVKIIHSSLPKKYLYTSKKPEKKVFQALRIAVNNELDTLEQVIYDFASTLNPSGRLAVITFHSLEDRIVKNSFKNLVGACDCPKDLPYCACGYVKKFNIITRKPIIPSNKEIKNNPRAKSAKLRVIEKLGD